jgi:hypothetical protein
MLSNNIIYLNNFIDNTDNGYSYNSTNIWNSTEQITYTFNGNTYTNYLGNYWSDYGERYPEADEIDESGIWDTPYSIDGDKDNYPLMEPWEDYIKPTPPEEAWNKTFGGSKADYLYSVQQISDGSYILTGYTASYGAGSFDGWLIKVGSFGNELWNKTYGGVEVDYLYSLQQTSDGGYILAGSTNSYGADNHDFWLLKTDSNGAEQWNRTFGSDGDEGAFWVEQTSDGGYILTGYTYSLVSYDAWLIKTNATGFEEWNQTFGGNSWDDAYSGKQISDGGYVLAGYTSSYGKDYVDAWLIKTNATGFEEWNQTFGGNSWDDANSIQQASDGGYILAGQTWSYGIGEDDLWLIKTDVYGNELWNQTFGGNNRDWATSIQQTSDGGYILTGFTWSYGVSPYDGWLIKVGPSPENQPPNLPTDLVQLKIDGTPIAVGALIEETTVVFKGRVNDPDGDKVKLQVELRKLDEYDGKFNESAGGFKENGFVESGDEATAYAYGLIDAEYHWRARAVDEHGKASDWVDFGDNDVLEVDFTVAGISYIYDPQAAVNYANTWWNGRNPIYHDYSSEGGDCANFVSQCLIAGGLDLSVHPSADSWGCIPSCTNLHEYLVNYIGVTWETRYTGEEDPEWFKPGDPAIFGYSDAHPRTHAVFAVASDASQPVTCNAHTVNRYHNTTQEFYDYSESDPHPFDRCTYYHIPREPTPAKPILTSPLEITPEKDTYYARDTLTAEFNITNIGDVPITLDKLLAGGRFNDGKLSDGEYPDFTFQSTTLQPNVPYHYTGTLTLTEPGNYHFFIAYYIENPTPEEKKLLDDNNWNTAVDLGEGLTDEDRIEDIVVSGASPSPGEFWVEVNREGACIYDRQAEKDIPDLSKPLKCLSMGWVLKRLTENGNPIEGTPDGIRWFNKVEDVTDGVSGWIERGDVSYDESKQQEWKEKTKLVISAKHNLPDKGFRFEDNLEQGDEGEEVAYLQVILKEENCFSDYVTGYFGDKTKSSVITFQEKYADEILTPVGLTKGTGFVGEYTRAKLNALLDEKYDTLIENKYSRKSRTTVIHEAVVNLLDNPPLWLKEDFLQAATREEKIALILALILQESWPEVYWFDNEIITFDCGRGILQLTSNELVGTGSGITCCSPEKPYLPYEFRGVPGDYVGETYWEGRNCNSDKSGHYWNCECKGDENVCWCGGKNDYGRCRYYKTTDCGCRHYTNTKQGVYANIKDGLYGLNDKYTQSNCQFYSSSCEGKEGTEFTKNYPEEGVTLKGVCGIPEGERKNCYKLDDETKKCVLWCNAKITEIKIGGTIIPCEEFRIIDAIWRYNGRSISNDYLKYIANNINEIIDFFGVMMPKKDEWIDKFYLINSAASIMCEIKSPGCIQIYDSMGSVTGYINGEITEGIPFSSYDEETKTIIIPFSYDSYRYEVVGTDTGTYGLEVTSVEDGKATSFIAMDIPTSPDATHQYTIDWDALSQGEEGVTIQVDSDGDGTFERTIIADSALTHDEFMLQTATTIDFDPDTLNLQSKGKWVTTYIKLPESYDVSYINVSTVVLNYQVHAEDHPTEIGDYDNDGIADLMVKFDRHAVEEILEVGEEVEVTVTGELIDGTQFEGTDTIRVIDKGGKK